MAFGDLAIVALAAAGVHSVISYAVARRTRDIGVRMAPGERPGRVPTQVLVRGMSLVAMGAGLREALLLGVSPRDLWIYAGAICGVACIGLMVNFVPARSAASVDPMKALRTE